MIAQKRSSRLCGGASSTFSFVCLQFSNGEPFQKSAAPDLAKYREPAALFSLDGLSDHIDTQLLPLACFYNSPRNALSRMEGISAVVSCEVPLRTCFNISARLPYTISAMKRLQMKKTTRSSLLRTESSSVFLNIHVALMFHRVTLQSVEVSRGDLPCRKLMRHILHDTEIGGGYLYFVTTASFDSSHIFTTRPGM